MILRQRETDSSTAEMVSHKTIKDLNYLKNISSNKMLRLHINFANLSKKFKWLINDFLRLFAYLKSKQDSMLFNL